MQSIRARINGLVVACAVPAAALGAGMTAYLSAGASLGTDASTHWLWLWPAASAAWLLGSLACADILSGRIARSMRELALARERTSRALLALTTERDRAAESAQRLRDERQQLEYRATHDELTGLVNRSRFEDLLRDRVAACQGKGGRLSVLYLDLDRFKEVNDRHGHATGDALLRNVAARLKTGVRASDLVGRLGGDEFGVIVDDAPPKRAGQIANELIRSISRPFQFGQLKVEIAASIGLAAYPAGGDSAEALLAAADASMYRAKLASRCRYADSQRGAR